MAFSFPQYMMSGSQEKKKSQGISKGKKQNKTKHTHTNTVWGDKGSIRPGMVGMLEVSDQELKTTIVNKLNALMDKVNSM